MELNKMKNISLIILLLASNIIISHENKINAFNNEIFRKSNIDMQAEKNIVNEFKNLYQELLNFKNEDDFKYYGFSVGYKYNIWLRKVEKLKDNPDSKFLLKKGFVAGELEQLGIAYVNSKGEETNFTKEFRLIFDQGLKK